MVHGKYKVSRVLNSKSIYSNRKNRKRDRLFMFKIEFTIDFRYNPHCSHREMTTKDILREKVGVCRQYVKIFSEMCMIADLSVKNIRGFSKAYTYLPGKIFYIHLHIYYTILIRRWASK